MPRRLPSNKENTTRLRYLMGQHITTLVSRLLILRSVFDLKASGNLLDYLFWRGDITFEQSGFCEVDALVLCQLSYLNFDGLISESLDKKERLALGELWEKFSAAPDFKERCDLGAMISELTVQLLEICAKSARFKNVEAAAFVNKIDLENEEQFCAMTFFKSASSKNPFVAFRGTDDTIVGWKEDFNLASKIVPAQRDALEYLSFVAKNTSSKIFVGGHSKGGNLAIYSAAFCEAKFKRRIERVYNFDGPGFSESMIQSKEMLSLVGAIRSFFPKFSIVGRLFRHSGEYQVVESEAFGIMQHEPFSWHIAAGKFETIDDFDKASEIFYKTFNEWVEELSNEQRELFVETLFTAISASGARTNSELEKNWFKNAMAILKAMGKIDKKTREEVSSILKYFVDIAAHNLVHE